MRRLIVLCVAVSTALLACGPVAAHQRLSRPTATPHAEPRVSFPFPMPQGIFTRPVRLATDPVRPEVWFWASSTSDSCLYRWDAATDRLSSWSVGIATQHEVGFQYGLAVDRTGQVWLGAGNQLLRLDPATGAVDRWTVPPAPVSAATVAHYPPGIGPDTDILAVAAAPDGTIVVARASSFTLQLFDPTTHTFSARALPVSGEIEDVAVDPDGTIAAAMLDYATNSRDLLELVGPTGRVTSVRVESDYVSAAGSSFLSGETGVEETTTTGRVTARTGPLAGLTPYGSAALGHGRVVVPSKTGVAIVDLADNSAESVTIPATCEPGAIPALPPGSEVVTRPGPCTAQAVAVAADAVGDAWFIDNAGRVGEVPSPDE